MAPERSFTISFISDVHGCFSNLDYASGKERASGLCNCAGLFTRGGNALVIDGGDALQGSPFTVYYHQGGCRKQYLPAQIMNAAGVQFMTLGNHDFNYGIPVIEQYLSQLHAVCLCANLDGIRGVRKIAVATLENGLRIGLTGVTSHYVEKWEPPENLKGVIVRDAFTSASSALEELRAQGADVTVCIYHGGFERDVTTGAVLSESDENQGWRICEELGFDILLTGHQHMRVDSACLFGTHTCQCPAKAAGFIRMDVSVPEDRAGKPLQVASRFVPAGERRSEKLWAYLSKEEDKASRWLDCPVGRLDRPLTPGEHLETAVNGSLLANFFNQVQLAASGAEVSVTCLDNTPKGLPKEVSIRDVASSYPFPNTLRVLEVDRHVLREALERCAEYFTLDENGELQISKAFLTPIEQHYSYDFYSGIETVFDVSRPFGQRVVSIRFQGEELPEGRKLKLCINSYRATGAGGYPAFAKCPVLWEGTKEISELIMDYISSHREIKVDSTKWLTVITGKKRDNL